MVGAVANRWRQSKIENQKSKIPTPAPSVVILGVEG
jgi:hypothetical protein